MTQRPAALARLYRHESHRHHPPRRPEVLALQERPRPVPAAHEVLIRVKAAGLNRSDIALREGKYGGSPVAGVVPGLEIAGEIVEVGANAPAGKPAMPCARL
ncbi:alcohol dehydrogenase catalytic domain-containing protein [Hymenobacter sp. BRD67]|uniref:alcohol dehydrogenase catalytic domain-containing protein n=1 Tax=Hymenobacter sp. BRD67 TaxID=2675877 RepID=UPI00293C0EB5|nr:alcohol dehydrogenase catalytic domain-containing protein [Hymenobacter sp. BRD67]